MVLVVSVLKSSPFVVKESGYAGFVMPIHVYFKGTEEPKEIHYDLALSVTQPVKSAVVVNHVFKNVSEEVKKRLLRAGAVSVFFFFLFFCMLVQQMHV